MSNGKGSSPRSNHSKQWRDNYDSMSLSLAEAQRRCADAGGYVWYCQAEDAHDDKAWRRSLGYKLTDDGSCGWFGITHFKTGVRNSRVRKQMTHKGKTVLLLDKDNEVVT